jgi:tetratricopeptide (TPR) repeat protein
MEERNKSIKKKQESSEILRLKGNRFFKTKDYAAALDNYMEALKLTPYEAKTLLNIAQV